VHLCAAGGQPVREDDAEQGPLPGVKIPTIQRKEQFHPNDNTRLLKYETESTILRNHMHARMKDGQLSIRC
jgi:hypothetical protein